MSQRPVCAAMVAVTLAAAIVTGCATPPASAQSSSAIPPFLFTPDRVQTSTGPLHETGEASRASLNFHPWNDRVG